jgi:DNA-binding MarR family transcriptional regulator
MPRKKPANNDSVAHFLNEWTRERPDLDPWPTGIFARIYRLSNRLVRRADSYLVPLGLSWEAFSMIVTLRRVGAPYELRPRDILSEGLLSSGAITNRIDMVEKLGLVERHPDPVDRRSVIIRLTPAGKRLADDAISSHFTELAKTMDVLDSSERDQLSDLLSKLLDSLEVSSEQNIAPRLAKSATDRAPREPARAGAT